MASPPLLEFETLLEPIPGDEPAGVATPFPLKQELDEARKEERPEDYDENDPRRPQQAKLADWATIIRLSREALARTSKDLMLSARLTEALTREHGFAGLRDGLHLMSLMIDSCWDRMHPSIEDGDLEVRATPLNWLDDPDRGARFPYTARMVPIVFGADRSFSAYDWRLLQEGRGGFTKEDFDKALDATPYERCQTSAEDLVQAIDELSGLQRRLEEKIGSQAPAFTSLRPALQDSQMLLQMIVQKKAPAAPAAATESSGGEAGAGAEGGGGAAPSRAATRDSLYQHLRDIAARLQAMEPHSPIPYLITKAIDLGNLPFPLLMRALIRDDNVLTEMNRELGIKPPEEASQ